MALPLEPRPERPAEPVEVNERYRPRPLAPWSVDLVEAPDDYDSSAWNPAARVVTPYGRLNRTMTSPLSVTLDRDAAGLALTTQAGTDEAPGFPTVHAPASGATRALGLSDHAELLAHVPTMPTRSRKGRTSFQASKRPVRVRRAPVTNEPTGLASLTEPELIALADSMLRRSDTVDGYYRRLIAGTGRSRYLLGSQIRPRAYAQMTPDLTVTTAKGSRQIRDRYYVSGMRPDAAGIAVHTADIDAGYLGHSSGVRQLRDLQTKRDATIETRAWSVRLRLHGTLRKAERSEWTYIKGTGQYVRRAAPAGHGYAALYRPGPTVCLAWHTDPERAWHGHTLTIRPPKVTRGKRQDRVPVVKPDQVARYVGEASLIAQALADGVRTLDVRAGKLTLAPRAGGVTACVLVRADGSCSTWRARSARAIAARIAV